MLTIWYWSVPDVKNLTRDLMITIWYWSGPDVNNLIPGKMDMVVGCWQVGIVIVGTLLLSINRTTNNVPIVFLFNNLLTFSTLSEPICTSCLRSITNFSNLQVILSGFPLQYPELCSSPRLVVLGSRANGELRIKTTCISRFLDF